MRPTLLLIALLARSLACRPKSACRSDLKKTDDWDASAEARKIADIVLTYQADAGGWPKNTDTVDKPDAGDRKKLEPTFDNKGTVDELRYMARMVNATKDATYRKSFDRGLAYVLAAQYPNGGWPQFFPLRGPERCLAGITFTDGAMVHAS
jgi:hypothetical protein